MNAVASGRRGLSLSAASGRLIGSILPLGLVAGVGAYLAAGGAAAMAAGIAAGLCLAGGLGALAAIGRFHGPQRAWFVIAAGAALRGGAPLVAGLMLRAGFPRLAAGRIEIWALVFYGATLLIELWLLPGLLTATSSEFRSPRSDVPIGSGAASAASREPGAAERKDVTN